MRPLFLSRAAARSRRAVLRACLFMVVPAVLVLTAGLAYAQPRHPSELEDSATLKESPVELGEASELFRSWERAPQDFTRRDVLPVVARLSVRARMYGVSQLEALPLLSVVEADVMQRVSSGHDCAAGADSYARLLQTATDEFMTRNAAVREAVQRLGEVYAGCAAARETITQVAAAGLSNVLVADSDGQKAAERQRAAAAALERRTAQVQNSPESSGGPLSLIETKIFDGLMWVGGDTLVQAAALAPALNPYSPQFKRFLWWCLLLAAFVIGRALQVSATTGLQHVLHSWKSQPPTTASQRTPAKAAKRRRKSVVVRRP